MSTTHFYSVLLRNFPFSPTHKQDVFFQKIAEFCTNSNTNEIFVLKGYAGTGKTTVVSTIVNHLIDINKKYVAVDVFNQIIRPIKGCSTFKFDRSDIVRDPILIDIIDRFEEFEDKGELPETIKGA